MAAPRKNRNIVRRRRLDDESDDRSVATEVADDSQSDISVPSDIDEDADADNSDLSDADTSPSLTTGKTKPKTNGAARGASTRTEPSARRAPSPPIAHSDATFTAVKDTEIMMNGLKLADKASSDEVVDFEAASPPAGERPASAGVASNRPETFADRKRREHEEYKKKRDSDPAFIPNRGAFFMHDQRTSHGQNGFRQYGPRGGARGIRGGAGGHIGGPYSPANQRVQTSEATESPWKHDLHETINDPTSHSQQNQTARSNVPNDSAPNAPSSFTKPSTAPTPKPPQVRNFSTTVHTHNALVRVFLPGMKAPIQFQNVPIKQHTRLPNHRPPLRRDKPVRISLPPAAPRYIFPTVDRSFIFIPRALRPNQQGFGRGRGRGFGSFGGGFSSRRTSAYGGSVYSPSVAMSRRSSMAREMGRDSLVSPAGSIMSRSGGFVDPSRPVVRLPPGGPKHPGPPVISPHMGTPNNMATQPYPLPQKPAFRENWGQGALPMHQPRPQKTVSVAGIESPVSMNFNPPQQQEQQPFHQQVPAHVNGNAPAEQQTYYPHARQLSYPSQASTGTPLSNIPERAIHAPAFQPFQQAGYQPQGYAVQPNYYYPQAASQQFVPPGGMVPMFVPNPQQGYAMPMAAGPPAPAANAPPTGPSMVPYESNGMTYYIDPSQMYNTAPPPMEGYPQPSYAVPGMGGMMTPSPEGAQYYYPQQMQPTGAVYYPPQ
ncbi:hypothetical protein BU24DRAFT_429887 [Aaosphaeria arxii CBS 175.79]|uniref:Btz domain-containing protein n=1 Tax=Aaosphaeria arxii CBS 175.79 TaxID=1450172 RepID=A0A6A5Y637_9PLEO|nr:uncharacterized protein BU24DRAFT_429887 [Aaosphaeria arxii CBS 175.79]KAF2021025.1 hypothetical protein BU24DRAFT_429887 [Aaosphaeria arxii CBS 175.79]